jgi:APA family basic amino acid/polyamine antiporter
VQNVFTAAKVIGLGGLIVAGLVLRPGGTETSGLAHFSPLFGTSKSPGELLAALGVAMIAALWCFDGWNNASFVAGEIKNPERNLVRGLVMGTAGVTLIYLLVNFVYLYVLPIGKVAASERVAAETARVLLGPPGGRMISLVVLVATFGSVNGMVLAGARVIYAMSREGHFFQALGRVHPRFHTPHLSLLVQGVWSCLLILLGGYEQLFTYVIFAAWIFYLLTTLAVVVLRVKWPQAERPFRVPGYPVVPLLFVAAALWFIANTLRERPWESLIGSAIVLIGVPVYLLWKKLSPSS